jgi:hypothetical protein
MTISRITFETTNSPVCKSKAAKLPVPKCNTEIVTPDLGREFQRNKGSRRLLKCLVCSQQDIQDVNTAESASDPTLGGDPMQGVERGGPVTPIPTSDAIKQGENSSAYPSKLMALLKDIKEHYSEDKR